MADKIIKYENAIVTYLDILGFRDIVINSPADKIAKLFTAIERFAKPDIDEVEAYKPIVHIFSDTIIRIRLIETDENRKRKLGLFFYELLSLVHIQLNLLQYNVLLRGAVSFGQVYSSGTQIFGPSIIRAYELEKNCAIYPRVIIDPLLLTEFENNELLRSDNKYEDELEYVYDLLQIGDDGFWFIDYLRAGKGELDSEEDWLMLLHNFKDMIIKNTKDRRLPENIIQKYMWLARYHNRLVMSMNPDWIRERNLNKGELLITESDVPTLKNPGIFAEEDDPQRV